MSDGLVIVGGSYAAVNVAAAARQMGYDAPIRILSAETVPPYQRPPLSKGYLTGAVADDSLPLRGAPFYQEQGIDLQLGMRVASIDLRSQEVATGEGRRIRFDQLALAVGARARKLDLPGAALAGISVLRDLADATKVKAALASAGNVVVVGGGYIGLEIAASAAKLNKVVTVLEGQDRILGRTCSPLLSGWFRRLHEAHGVRIVTNAGIVGFRGGSDGAVRAVDLADGSKVPADLVIVGIGVDANDELARHAGLACEGGILVDGFAQTSNAAVVAAGDCTRFATPYSDRPLRVESVQNATDQAKSAAAAVMGLQKPHDALPWFWSDQYEAKLQMAGLSQGHDDYVVRGDPDAGAFSVFYFRRGALVAVDSVSRPAEHMLARRLIVARIRVGREQASDAGFDLKSLLAAAA